VRLDEKHSGGEHLAGGSSTERLISLIRPFFKRLLVVLALLFLLTGLNMILPLFIKLLIDEVFPNRNFPLLFGILGGVLGIYILRNIIYFACKYAVVQIGENLSFSLRNRLFERMQQMSLYFYRQNKPGQISSRMMNDTFQIQSFLQDEFPTFLQSLLMFIGLVAIIFAVNWQLALVSTIVLPIHLLAARHFRRPIKFYGGKAQEQLSLVQGNLIEKFLGAEVVKGFGGEERESRDFRKATEKSRESQLLSRRYHVGQKVVSDLLIGLGTIGLIGFGAYQVMGPRQMAPGTFMAFFSYVLMLYPVVLELMSGLAKLTKVSASVDRVFELMNEEESIAPPKKPIRPTIEGAITFDHVHFNYPGATRILKDLHFEIPQGKVCVITGPSGSGKSTLLSLIPRFSDPSEGTVKIDGIDLRKVDLNHLRSQIGIAFQECFLFNSSILENLRYAAPGCDFEEIRRVARLTGAESFIERFPQGYHTILGEKGVSLSRGEKQSITLTRAVLKNPSILLMDEATASMDTENEGRVLSAIFEIMKNRTIILVTHNPRLLQNADLKLRLEQGRLIEIGTSGAVSGHGQGSPHPAPSFSKITALAKATMAGLAFFLALGLNQETLGNEPIAESSQWIPFPGVNEVELQEMGEIAQTRLTVDEDYRALGREESVPIEQPENVRHLFALRKSIGSEDSEAHLFLRGGYRIFRSQPAHLWLQAVAPAAYAEALKDEMEAVEALFENLRLQRDEQYDHLSLTDLNVQTIVLSYVDVDRCLALLKTFGYQVVEFDAPTRSVGKQGIINPNKLGDLEQLPIILPIPETDHLDLVSGAEGRAGGFGLSGPGLATAFPGHTSASPAMKLMVLYHPARPEQFSALNHLIRTHIDVPARQILIEAMVLEISEAASSALGLEWNLRQEYRYLDSANLGSVIPFGMDPTLELLSHERIFGYFQTRLEALVQSGEAEVLSRPSILTLDNRQASIRVGEEIPVAKTVAGIRATDRVSFDFSYLPVGIMLNVRPRISADNTEVSLQIDGSVSATVVGEDLILRDADRQELARAPRISTRRVQTYSRVANNTPFIIGGLISSDEVVEQRKVPLLGDIPFLGLLFRSDVRSKSKSEVIIVITPHVLEDPSAVDRLHPKDVPQFDSDDHKLFRDAYRLRSDDVFDLAFLRNNHALVRLQKVAEDLAQMNYRFREQYPFNQFVRGRMPGENILVYRQMYNLISRLGMDREVELDRLIYMEGSQTVADSFSVSWVMDTMARIAGLSPEAPRQKIFEALGDQALAFTFTINRRGDPKSVLEQPVPELYLVDCPDRSTWDRLLWELNQPDEDGNERYTILLHDERDLTRLKRAVQLKNVVALNSGNRIPRLENFRAGAQVLMPSIQPGQIQVLDSQTARYFFHTQHYYPAMRQEIIRASEAFIEALRDDVDLVRGIREMRTPEPLEVPAIPFSINR